MDRQKKLLQLLGLIVILISVLIYYGYNHMNKKERLIQQITMSV